MNIDKNFLINDIIEDGIRWIDPLTSNRVKVYGFAWLDENKKYHRMPFSESKAINEICPNINHLASNTSGGQIHLITTSKKLMISVKMSSLPLLSGMTAVAQGGFDCYVGSDYDNLKFYDSARFPLNANEYTYTFFSNEIDREKLVVLNFPLYGGVQELRVGIEDNSMIKPSLLENKKRIIIYGTSITQGGCASRPGLSFTNILSRRFKKEFINLGFSGNAFGEEIIANIIARINDVEMFILDYEANAGTNGKLEKTLERFIRILRGKHPQVPIVVVSRIKYLFDDLNHQLGIKREEIRMFQVNLVKKFNDEGDQFVFYIDGSKLLGKNYHEFTIDSIHPNDLGFMQIANSLEKELKKIYYSLD